MFEGHNRKVKVETPDGPKVVSMLEGAGVYTCHTHHYSTEDLSKFNAHCREDGHILGNSESNCIMCGKEHVSMEGVQTGQNAICDECTLKLAEQAKAVQKRLAAMRGGK